MTSFAKEDVRRSAKAKDLTLNYSIPRARLQELAAFCRASRGFVVS